MHQIGQKHERSQIVAIVLAAGQSRRMGEAKLLLAWGSTTMLGQTLAHVQASTVDKIVVVTGAYRPKIAEIVSNAGLPSYHNPDYAKGEMISSLQVGLRHCQEADGVLVMLGDMPLIEPKTINAVIAAFKSGLGEIVAPVFGGRQGHPVLFGRNHFPTLLNLPYTATPRTVLHQNQHVLHRLPVDTNTILIDLDTPESYARWRPDLES